LRVSECRDVLAGFLVEESSRGVSWESAWRAFCRFAEMPVDDILKPGPAADELQFELVLRPAPAFSSEPPPDYDTLWVGRLMIGQDRQTHFVYISMSFEASERPGPYTVFGYGGPADAAREEVRGEHLSSREFIEAVEDLPAFAQLRTAAVSEQPQVYEDEIE
jgi:hypothetical protein